MQVPPVSSAPVAESVCKYAVSGPVNIVNVLGHGKQDHSHAVHLLQVRPTFWKCVQDQRPACWDMFWTTEEPKQRIVPCTSMYCNGGVPNFSPCSRKSLSSWCGVLDAFKLTFHSHTHTHPTHIWHIYPCRSFFTGLFPRQPLTACWR